MAGRKSNCCEREEVMKKFQPDYRNIVQAASNIRPDRVPLYEHGVDLGVIETFMGRPILTPILEGSYVEKVAAYRDICGFYSKMGYDIVPWEWGACYVVQSGYGLCGRSGPLIRTMDDLQAWDWDGAFDKYVAKFDDQFRALAEALPEGMKVIGGIGNGIFETTQDFVPLIDLAYLQADEPEVYSELWNRVGDLFVRLWSWLLPRYGEMFAVCRMGDDLGFRSSTLIQPAEIRGNVIPHYKRVVDIVHGHGKKFLLHSCGCIFEVMDDIITQAAIDAKHSNEDAISPFSEWLEKYNDRIGIFGGIDMDLLCRADEQTIRRKTLEVLELAERYNGFALGCGNSIANYVPFKNYLMMVNTVREYRGDF